MFNDDSGQFEDFEAVEQEVRGAVDSFGPLTEHRNPGCPSSWSDGLRPSVPPASFICGRGCDCGNGASEPNPTQSTTPKTLEKLDRTKWSEPSSDLKNSECHRNADPLTKCSLLQKQNHQCGPAVTNASGHTTHELIVIVIVIKQRSKLRVQLCRYRN